MTRNIHNEVSHTGYLMKTKGSTSYTGVTLGELKKYFTDDALIEVSKKFLNAHKMIAGDAHESLTVEKEDTGCSK